MTRRMAVAAVMVALRLASAACKREQRRFREIPPSATAEPVEVSELRPGLAPPPPETRSPYEDNAYAVAEGKRLYEAYNCVGCHAHGGGGMGPPLMDKTWIYGPRPDQIFSSIIEGRPNGMPAFRRKVPNPQAWQLAAYVRSMSGLIPLDVAPNRDDDMNVKKPENRQEKQLPKISGPGVVR
jgi:cytochrome c oxidase cbb3-type subunit 3